MTLTDIATLRNLAALIGFVVFILLAMHRLRPKTRRRSGALDTGKCLHFGASLITDGFEYYPDWSAAMRREFDDGIKPQLKQLYKSAQMLADHPKKEWPAMIERLTTRL